MAIKTKTMKYLMCILLLFALGAPAISAEKIRCRISGTLVDRDSRGLLLLKATGDLRSKLVVHIPVHDRKFDYLLECDEQEAYQLVFEEEWDEAAFNPVIFFPDTAQVRLELYPMREAETKNRVIGGKLNRSYQRHLASFAEAFRQEYLDIRQQRKKAIAAKTYYTPAYDSLLALSRSSNGKTTAQTAMTALSNTGADLSEEGRSIQAAEKAVVEKMFVQRYEYIRRESSPVSFYMMYHDLTMSSGDIPAVTDLAGAAIKLLENSWPKHAYHARLNALLTGKKLQPGNSFVDFNAADPKGKVYKFSAIRPKKLLLLDLWASWCGPCIAKSREVMALYREFADKGFEVIGVAREFDNLKNLQTALDREKHPWRTLVDLDDRFGVWNKYGLDNSGGGMMLFDSNGKILAINPGKEELTRFVKERLTSSSK